MTVEVVTIYTCEGCLAQTQEPGPNAPLPADWITVTIGGNDHIFHSAACAAAWLIKQAQ